MEGNPNWVEVSLNNRTVRGTLSWDLLSEGRREPLVLVSARAHAASRILHDHQIPDYHRFEELIRQSASKRAISTAKKAAFRIASAEGAAAIHGATLTVMQYGVVPVFARKQPCSVVVDGETQSARIAIYPQYRPAPADGRQLPLAGLAAPAADRAENFYIAHMLSTHLEDCIDKYFRDVSRHFARVVEQSSYPGVFLQIRMIREVLTESLRSKLDTIRKGLTKNDEPEPDRSAIREMFVGLRNLVVRIEIFLLAIDEMLAAFFDVLGLHIESPAVARRNAARQTHSIQDQIVIQWGKVLTINRDDVEHLLGHDPYITALKALRDHIRLGTFLEPTPPKLEWLWSCNEFARRVRFLKQKSVRLHELNVFLSKRSMNREVLSSMFGSPDGSHSYKVREYSPDTPPANNFYDEIDWLVWACYGFLSIMEHTVPADPEDNLAWLVRELDLAVSYNRVPNISIIRPSALSVARLKQLANDETIWLFQRPHIAEPARRTLLAQRIESLLHISHQDSRLGATPDELSKVVKNVQKVIREMYERFAGDFLVGWASIFSSNTLKALEAIYSPDGRALSSTRIRDIKGIGKNTVIRDIAKNVQKYQLSVNGRRFQILSVVERAGPAGSRPLALEPCLRTDIAHMFPGAPVDKVLERFAAGLPRLFAPKE